MTMLAGWSTDHAATNTTATSRATQIKPRRTGRLRSRGRKGAGFRKLLKTLKCLKTRSPLFRLFYSPPFASE